MTITLMGVKKHRIMVFINIFFFIKFYYFELTESLTESNCGGRDSLWTFLLHSVGWMLELRDYCMFSLEGHWGDWIETYSLNKSPNNEEGKEVLLWVPVYAFVWWMVVVNAYERKQEGKSLWLAYIRLNRHIRHIQFFYFILYVPCLYVYDISLC